MQDRDLPTFSFDADFQVESYLRYQGSSFVERFDANSYLYLTRAMDYFDIAADHDGVLARAFRGIKTRFCVVSFTSDWLFPTRNRARWCMRSTHRARGCRSPRSKPIAATTLSCSTCPNSSNLAGLPGVGGQGAGPEQDGRLDMRSRNRLCRSAVSFPIVRGNYRADHLLVAGMVSAARRCSTSARRRRLLQLLESRGVDGRGIALSREGVDRCVAKELRGAGRRRHRSRQLSGRWLRLRDPVADPPGDATAAGRAGKSAADRTAAPSSRSRDRLLEDSAPAAGRRPHAAHRKFAAPGTDTPNIHFSAIKAFVQLCDAIDVKMERAVALDLYRRRLRLDPPWRFWNMFGEQGVPLLSRGGGGK